MRGRALFALFDACKLQLGFLQQRLSVEPQLSMWTRELKPTLINRTFEVAPRQYWYHRARRGSSSDCFRLRCSCGGC